MENSVRSAAEKALAQPRYCYEVIKDGFKFMIVWHPQRSWFECTMSFSPDWPHTHFIYGSTIDRLSQNIDLEIADAKKTFTEGGKYPADYGTTKWFNRKRQN